MMAMLRFEGNQTSNDGGPYRFPVEQVRSSLAGVADTSGRCEVTQRALDALDDSSRRIDDLARDLNVLGYFDNDDDDRPRAA